MRDSLYIIGNGFDLHHKLDTSYWHFEKYLKENDSELHYLLESNIFYPQKNEDLWSDFEENLGYFDINELLSENEELLPNYSDENFRDGDIHNFPDQMEYYCKKLTEDLFENFANFIRNVAYPENAVDQKILIDKNSYFLNFNFTNTLERLYEIDQRQIKYIHNSAIYKDEQIILGHSKIPKRIEDTYPTPPDNIDPMDYDKWYEQNIPWEYSFDTGKENIYHFYEKTFKPTQRIIEENRLFFSKLQNIKKVFIYGHSLSIVDLPYFQEVFENVDKDAKWQVSFYSDEEKDQQIEILNKIGVRTENIEQIELEEIKIKKKSI